MRLPNAFGMIGLDAYKRKRCPMPEFSPELLQLLAARVLLTILLLALVLLVRGLLRWLITRPLKRLLGRPDGSSIDTTLSNIAAVPVRYLLLALALDIGARIWGVQGDVLSFVVHVSRTFVIVAIAILINNLIRLLTQSRPTLYRFTGTLVEDALLPFVRTGAQIVLIAIALVIIIQEWDYDVTGLIAGLGVGSLAVSLAAQDTLSNLFGFTALVGDRPFVVGEFIKTPDVEGTVEQVGLRSTRIRRIDQASVYVPNSKLAGSPILNWSRLSKRQIDMTLNLTYRTQSSRMQEFLETLRLRLAERSAVERDSIVVYLVNIDENALKVLVRCYLMLPDWKSFTAEKEQILLDILKLVDEMDLEIAFASRRLIIEASQPLPIAEVDGRKLAQTD